MKNQNFHSGLSALALFCLMLFLSGFLSACSGSGMVVKKESSVDLITTGRFKEAQAAGMKVPEMSGEVKAGPNMWEETLDGGDDPLHPGCACRYEQPDCAGNIAGRAVDECFPHDGVSLNEKTIPTACGKYGDKTYNCEDLLGKGAKCKLIDLTCCGVKTTSGYCDLDVTGVTP